MFLQYTDYTLQYAKYQQVFYQLLVTIVTVVTSIDFIGHFSVTT